MSTISPRDGSNLQAPNGVSIQDIHYNAEGLTTLRSFLGEGAVYEQYKDRFDLADIAWFAAGAQRQAHQPQYPATFHPYFLHARASALGDWKERSRERLAMKNRLLTLLFEAAAMLDLSFGGATAILHTGGTVAPGQPMDLEFVKTDFYISAHVMAEMPGVKVPLAEIIQKWTESVGLSTVRRWDKAFKKTGLDFREKVPGTPFVARSKHNTFLPPPTPGTSHYVCYGRAIGELDDMIWNSRSMTQSDRGGPARSKGLTNSIGEDDPLALRRRILELEALFKLKDGQIEDLQERISELSYAPFLEPPFTDAPVVKQSTATPVASPRPRAAAAAPKGEAALSTKQEVIPMTPPPTAPTRAATPAPMTPVKSDKRAGKAPEYVSKGKTAITMSSLSSSISSVSTADWPTPTASPSPSQCGLVFPPPPPPPSASLSQLTASSSPSPLTRFRIVGPLTDAIIRQYQLDREMHRGLRLIIRHVPENDWFAIVQTTWELSVEVVDDLVDAMIADVPGE